MDCHIMPKKTICTKLVEKFYGETDCFIPYIIAAYFMFLVVVFIISLLSELVRPLVRKYRAYEYSYNTDWLEPDPGCAYVQRGELFCHRCKVAGRCLCKKESEWNIPVLILIILLSVPFLNGFGLTARMFSLPTYDSEFVLNICGGLIIVIFMAAMCNAC